MIERLVRWLIAKYLPGYHLHKDPPKGRKHPVYRDGKLVTQIITSDGLRPEEAYDFGKELPPGIGR